MLPSQTLFKKQEDRVWGRRGESASTLAQSGGLWPSFVSPPCSLLIRSIGSWTPLLGSVEISSWFLMYEGS